MLISSSIHMRRAMDCFQKTGVEVRPYPTNQLDPTFKYTPGKILLPDPAVLNSWKLLIHEVAGYIIYWIKGYV
ncbi:MAG: ElyC/SanA/YdcF family protein [Bacteroidota bacterium]